MNVYHTCQFPSMLKRSLRTFSVIFLLVTVSASRPTVDQGPQKSHEKISNGSGMQLMIAEENTQPTLRIVLPGHSTSDRAIEIIFPEHVTIRPRGKDDPTFLYMFQPGQVGKPPRWRQSGRSLEYEKNFPGVDM